MPVNIYNNKSYQIDYPKLYNELNGLRIFDNSKIQEKYLDLWLKLLEKCDKNVMSEKLNNMHLIMRELTEAPEIFQFPIHYNSCDVFIHFRVSRIIQALKQSKNDAQRIPIEEFTKKKCGINWTETTDNVLIKNEPILMVPFVVDRYYKELVIDGNHRITDSIKRSCEFVLTYYLDGDYIVNANMFSTEFDKLFYVFQNELVTMGTYTLRDKIVAEKLVEKSYLNTEKMLALNDEF